MDTYLITQTSHLNKCKWRIPSVCFAEQNGRDA